MPSINSAARTLGRIKSPAKSAASRSNGLLGGRPGKSTESAAKESSVLKRVMLTLGSRQGVRVFRNNCGAYRAPDGSFVRYGVANPGGSDLIGWRMLTVTPEMIGTTVAQFIAVECKTESGRTSRAQDMFLSAVNKSGGLGIIARSENDANI